MNELDLSKLKSLFPKIIFGVLAAALIAVVGSLVLGFFLSLFPPKVVSAVPSNSQKAVTPTTTIRVTFDKNISSSNRSKYSILPAAAGQIFIQGKVFEFVPNRHLDFGQSYVFSLIKPISESGREGDSVVLSFTVKTYDVLDASEKFALQREQDLAIKKQADQAAGTLEGRKGQALINLLGSMPYDSASFSVQYLSDQDLFYVTLKKNPYNDSKQAALDWFKSKGVEDMSWINVRFGSVRGVYP